MKASYRTQAWQVRAAPPRRGVALLACLAAARVWFTLVPAQAQTAPPATNESGADQLESPRIESLPPITLPVGVEVPADGRVGVVVEVAVDGSARLEQCEASEEVCARVREAIGAASFRPARRAGQPIAARVRVVLQLASAEPPAPESAPEPASAPEHLPPAAAQEPAAPRAAEPGPELEEFGASAHIVPPQPGMRRLELAEMRDLPGAFGDPFRAVEVLPGVVPVLSGLPYFYIRGSPPAGTLYVYDEIPVPTLYHLAVGPAVIHPRMVGPVRLYSGVAPARYGRLTGGVVAGEGPEPPDGRTHAEAELRLLDLSGYVQTPALDGTLTAAVRYGYPALLLSIFSPEVSLAYWDYQLRYETRLSSKDRFELVALGSYDSFGVADEPEDAAVITFHRVEPRLVRRVGATEVGAALLLGFEESKLGSEFQLQATRIAPRMWLAQRFSERARLRLSADLTGIVGFFSSSSQPMSQEERRVRDKLYGDVPARSLWGVQAELTLLPWQALELQLGARADGWVQGTAAMGVLDPRARAIVHTSDTTDLHLALGVVHQPAVFYLPLPGLADVANDRGLQTAIQSEAGVGWDTPLDLRAELQLFLHHYDNLVFTDALFLDESFDTICGSIDCGDVQVQDRISGYSYGAELFLRRDPSERISGFLSYTLAFSAIDDVAGVPYTPTWDVRHVGNLVLHSELGAGFSAGARLHARSGKLQGEFIIDDALQLARDERRLPWFVRLDLQVAYAWQPSWGRMRLSLEWFNATLSREPQSILCTGRPRTCEVQYLPAIFFPNLGLRGEL